MFIRKQNLTYVFCLTETLRKLPVGQQAVIPANYAKYHVVIQTAKRLKMDGVGTYTVNGKDMIDTLVTRIK